MLEIFIWIVGTGMVAVAGLLGYRYWMRKEKETTKEAYKSVQDKEESGTELNTAVSSDCVPRIEWMELPHNLYFDEKRGYLRYGDEVSICLKDNSLRLFRRFIEAEQFKLTFKDICIEVLGRSVKAEIQRGDKAVVSHIARRLRKALAPFPFIQIEVIWAVGYRMIIEQPDVSEEKQSHSEMEIEQTK